MVVRSLPAVALTISFMDCISRGDVRGPAELMSPDHRLEVFDEALVVTTRRQFRLDDGP